MERGKRRERRKWDYYIQAEARRELGVCTVLYIKLVFLLFCFLKKNLIYFDKMQKTIVIIFV